jgi:fructoselysine-6-P-deglycase FrlB-like protein
VSEIEREIASQPACWEVAAERASVAGDTLPQAGARVAAVGCGTSLYVAQTFAWLREAAGQGETDAFSPSEARGGRRYDVTLLISRSGTTTEVVRFLEQRPVTRTAAIVADPGSPVARTVDRFVALEFADERSVVQTRFATSALALLRTHLGQDLGPAIADARRALASPLPVEPEGFAHFVFLGQGWTTGLANEAALKLREAAQAWTESYPAMEYRHGPISVAGPRTLAWAIGPVDAGVLEDVAVTGATVVAEGLDPLAELVLIQRAAVALADSKGLDPDQPPHLTRSVVIT